jgi:hypothetical protein
MKKTYLVGLYYPDSMCKNVYPETWFGTCKAANYLLAIENAQREVAKANGMDTPEDFACFVVIRGSSKIVYRA